MKHSIISAFLIFSVAFLFACTDSTSPTSAMEESVDGKVMNEKTPPTESGRVERVLRRPYWIPVNPDAPNETLFVNFNPFEWCAAPGDYVVPAIIRKRVYTPLEYGDPPADPAEWPWQGFDPDKAVQTFNARDVATFLFDANFFDELEGFMGDCSWLDDHLIASGGTHVRTNDNDVFVWAYPESVNHNAYSVKVNGQLDAVDGSKVNLQYSEHCVWDGNDPASGKCKTTFNY